MTDSPILLWFRRDLRLSDHEALTAADATGRPIIPVFIFDDVVDAMGTAPKWRLEQALACFKQSLRDIGSDLILRRGDALTVLTELMAETGAQDVYWSRGYDPKSVARDTAVKAGLNGHSFRGLLLYEPWVPKTKMGGYFKVYTPFWRHVSSTLIVDAPLPAVSKLTAPEKFPRSDELSDWNLGAGMKRGAEVVAKYAQVGEGRAFDRLQRFLAESVDGYKTDRDFPMRPATSGLSENLTYGEISPRSIFCAGQAAMQRGAAGAEHFIKELVWREFAYHLMWHFAELDTKCWKEDWETFPWDQETTQSEAWKQGRTGQDFVDAGMRELYATGTMHNRLRMIVGSYLTKHLMTDWRIGLSWFADCLIDWDPAANAMGWQWIAGCGPDAALYFRVFNPELQSERFDGDGAYRNKWLNHQNSDHAKAFLQATPKVWGMEGDSTRPNQLVSLSQGRDRALETYKKFKG